jgi:hypothetical protein
LEEQKMRRIIGTMGATLVVALVTPTLALASSHREATKILKDPTADNVDVYAMSAVVAVPLAAFLLRRAGHGVRVARERAAGTSRRPDRP